MTQRTDYVARTALGAIIATFETRDQAMAWADVDGERFPGWQIVAVTERTVVTSRVLRRDRSQMGAAA